MAALGSAVIIAGLTQTANAASADTKPTRTPETATPVDYIAYLAHQSANGAAGAGEALQAFRGLSSAAKETYLDHLNNPAALEALLQAVGEAEPDPDPETASAPVSATAAVGETKTVATTTASKTLADGDIVIETTQEATFTPDPDDIPGPTQPSGKLRRGTWESTYRVTQRIFGVPVTRLSVWVNYYTNGNKITRVNHADGGKRNFNAAVAITKSLPKAWKSGSYANGSVGWEGSIVFKDFGITIDKRQKVYANEYGFRGGYLKNI
ncbi:hypothetical protein [Streptomyces sp. HM190]|uniref:hypothetical protein n=1 Tax=Streptomyces sp. HM190 TaxID=2695266 RepID=UPI0013584E79|nr:hypothetical protein [Streptomyces sp. HM190]